MIRRRQPLSVAIYLGSHDDRRRRLAMLDILAGALANGNRSRLIQMIADGELDLVPRATSSAPDAEPESWHSTHLT